MIDTFLIPIAGNLFGVMSYKWTSVLLFVFPMAFNRLFFQLLFRSHDDADSLWPLTIVQNCFLYSALILKQMNRIIYNISKICWNTSNKRNENLCYTVVFFFPDCFKYFMIKLHKCVSLVLALGLFTRFMVKSNKALETILIFFISINDITKYINLLCYDDHV